MAKLSKHARARLPAGDFAGPGRSFPVNDKGHARAALLRVGQSQKAGTITAHEAAVIRGAARRELKG